MKKAGWVALFLCAALWMVGVTGSAVEEGTPLPVLMYHALLRNPNAWNDYVLSPDALEQDLIWLKAHGYSFVLPSQVIGFVQNGNPLPEKPVMITLDDGCLNHLTYLPEILERQDACAFLSVVGEYTEKADAEGEGHPEYSYLRSEDIGKLLQTGRVEIGNHSYNLHGLGQRRGAMRCASESREHWREVLTEDARRTQNLLRADCGVTPKVYTYPYGLISDGADEILKEMGFAMTLSCFERVTVPTSDESCLYSVGRFNRPSGISTEAFMRKIGLE